MKTLLIIAVTSMAVSGTSFIPAPQENKEQTASISTPSQVHDFSYFRLHRQGKGNVVLNWAVTSLDGVEGFAVERSYDGDFYEVISQTPCNGELKHSHKDQNIFPGYIYYRITCIMNDGSNHSTEVLTVRIVQH